MREFIGVSDPLILLSIASLKQETLMFSRIALPYLDSITRQFSECDSTLREVVSEIEWLIDKGVIFEPIIKIDDEGLRLSEDFRALRKEASKYAEELDEKSIKRSLTPTGIRIHPWLLEINPKVFGLNVRLFSIQLRILDKMDAHPVLTIPARLAVPAPTNTNRSDVALISLNALPIPDESTPWEQIIEYRSDPDSRSKFLALRHWMSEVARAELTPAEVEEKLEYLIDQYQRHMRLHRMKTNVGTLETVVTTGAEFLGDLVSFKWSKAVEALFSLRRRRVALLEEELTAPGNEVAYIVKARETFGNE